MYPFFVLDIDRDATDEEVSSRYHVLVRSFPPDRSPEAFSAVRTAYEALRYRRSRLRAWLFSFDRFGRALVEAGPTQLEASPRPRTTAERLSAALRESRRRGAR